MLLKKNMASRGQCIGLMGGSFNPPHQGHKHVADTVLKRLGLDAVWWLVSPQNPLKERHTNRPYQERLAAVHALTSSYRMKASMAEHQLKTVYTFDTVRKLRICYPGVCFVWIMGSDSLHGFHHWRAWQSLVRIIPVVVVGRPGLLYPPGYAVRARLGRYTQVFAHHRLPGVQAGSLARYKPPVWLYLTAPLKALSSSDLRSKIKKTKDSLP